MIAVEKHGAHFLHQLMETFTNKGININPNMMQRTEHHFCGFAAKNAQLKFKYRKNSDKPTPNSSRLKIKKIELNAMKDPGLNYVSEKNNTLKDIRTIGEIQK